jgi:hypothetical protein
MKKINEYFLAWQENNQGVHIRKFNRSGKWLKWEKQSDSAKAWLAKWNDPQWTEKCDFLEDADLLVEVFGSHFLDPYEIEVIND